VRGYDTQSGQRNKNIRNKKIRIYINTKINHRSDKIKVLFGNMWLKNNNFGEF
jgi:hypothetical protein